MSESHAHLVSVIFAGILAILYGLVILVLSFTVETLLIAGVSAASSSLIVTTVTRFTHPPAVVIGGLVLGTGLIAGGLALIYSADVKFASLILSGGLLGAFIAAIRQQGRNATSF